MTTPTTQLATAPAIARLLVALLACAAAAPPAVGQQPSPATSTRPAVASAPGVQLTAEAIQARLGAAEKAEGLSAADRQAAVDLYKRALEEVAAAGKGAATAAAYERTLQAAPDEIRRLQQAASQPATEPAPQVPPDMPLEETEARLKQHELQLAECQKQSTELTEGLKSRAERRSKLPELIAQTQGQLQKVKDALGAAVPPEQPQVLKDARRTHLLARQKALEAQLEAFDKEVTTYEVRGSLLRAQRDAATRSVSRLQEQVKTWQQAVARRRGTEARRHLEQARQAERDAAGKHEIVRRITRRTTQFAEWRTGPTGLNERRKGLDQELLAVNARLTDLEQSFSKVKDMVAKVGLSDAIGMLLRRHRAALPDVREHRRNSAARKERISEVQVRLFELNELLSELADVDARGRSILRGADPPVAEREYRDVLASVHDALQDRKQLLIQLVEDYDQYFSRLVELDTAESRLVARAEAFGQYIGERILWTRSTAALKVGDAARSWQALRWLFDPGSWAGVAAGLWSDLRDNPLPIGAAVLVLAGLLLGRRKLTAAMLALDERAAGTTTDAFGRTLLALLMALLLSITWPLVTCLVGWRLLAAREAGELSQAIGLGLLIAAAVGWPVGLLRQVCRPNGVGEAHFRWPAEALRTTGRSLRRLMTPGLALVFLIGTMESCGIRAHANSLGRLALIAALVLLSAYLGRMLRPKAPLVQQTFAHRRTGWVYRTRRLWHPLAAIVPLALAAASVLGYHYAAVQLSWRLVMQFWVILALILSNAMLYRWLFLARRRLALKAAEQRRQAEEEKQQQAEEKGLPPEAPPPEPVAIDLSAVSVQTRQLVRYLMAALLLAGVWAVWADVLPALGMLRQIALWHVAANGARKAVTLADLGLAVVIVALTAAAARNIPGMLELVLLQRLHIEAGGRNAITTLARYLISAVGVVVAFEVIGIKWAHVQWLIAAMTVGLGFGLQEIFANFVSGLIILVERPIRIGDVVTVGDVSGTVTRIRIRATTITDWDRKELIVPNKAFITGQLVNWTLSDTVLRLVIRVGIAYGSDTALAEKVLRELADANERVLDDPAPIVLFTDFGDSSLDFELRVYIGGLKDYLPVLHELRMAIDQAFRRHGIEIAFPQQDVHIRSIKAALPVERRRPSDRDTPPPDALDRA